MVGSSLAKIIKLPIPDYGLCFMSKEVIMETNTNEEIDSNNSGISFYSVLMPNSVPANSGILSAVTNPCCERLILFDYLINNRDRHNGNLLVDLENDPRMICIDNSHVFLGTGNADPLAVTLGVSDVRAFMDIYKNDFYTLIRRLCGFSIQKFKDEAEFIKNSISRGKIIEILQVIPTEWTADDDNILEGISRMLDQRIKLLDTFVVEVEKERVGNG